VRCQADAELRRLPLDPPQSVSVDGVAGLAQGQADEDQRVVFDGASGGHGVEEGDRR